jgi:hypothetical protein|tara:strand:+ start:208 stop:390 length:183 start_codon:yes stop_codon:yes gene_type:complete
MSLVDIVSDHLFNDDTKKAIIDGLNEKIDIPIINERTEEKILTAIYDVVEDVMKKVLGAK